MVSHAYFQEMVCGNLDFVLQTPYLSLLAKELNTDLDFDCQFNFSILLFLVTFFHMQRWPHKMLNLNKVRHNIVRDIFEDHPSTHVSLIYQHPPCTFARDHHRGENDSIINVLWITYLDKKTSYLLPNLVPAFHYLLLTPWNTWWICSLAEIFLTGTPASNLKWKYQIC